jgi:hypothetical protein
MVSVKEVMADLRRQETEIFKRQMFGDDIIDDTPLMFSSSPHCMDRQQTKVVVTDWKVSQPMKQLNKPQEGV